jgi:LmeA-like phospholipid-binding
MRRLAALGITVLVLVLLGVAQLVLPGIAAQRLRDRLAHSGTVLEVKVDAFPAIKLLWHQADHVVVRMADYRSSTADLGDSLAQTSDAGTVDASAATVHAGLLTLRNATLRKRGDTLTGTAQVSEADLRAAVPFLDNVQPVAAVNGTLTLRGTATLFGVTASADATVGAQNGKLLVQPDLPFGGLATVTLFDNPHVAVESVSAAPLAGGFGVAATAHLQ